MLRAHLRRGAAAGLLGGALAALVGLVVGQPLLDAAIVIEEQLHHGPEHADGVSRALQQVGMTIGMVVVGLVVGVVFGVLAAWAAGRVEGDGWSRHLRLGGALLAALVVLPALAYPPNPPGAVEDVPGRAVAYALVVVLGCGLVAGLRLVGRTLRTRGTTRPGRQTLVGGLALAATALVLVVRPELASAAPEFPGELLWRYRLVSIGVQAALVGGTAVVFGLLAARAERVDTTTVAS